MFQKLGDALRRFMYGRYGADSLNKWLLIFAGNSDPAGLARQPLSRAVDGCVRYAGICAADLVAVPDVLAQHRSAPPGKRGVSSASSPACATGRTATSPVRAAGRLSVFRAARAESISAAPNAASSSSGKPEQNTRRRLLWKLPAGVCVPIHLHLNEYGQILFFHAT